MRLPSAAAAPNWAALEVADVCEDENPVVEEDEDCDENTPVDDVVKSCADEVADAMEANSCVVPGVDEAEANACVEPRVDDKVATGIDEISGVDALGTAASFEICNSASPLPPPRPVLFFFLRFSVAPCPFDLNLELLWIERDSKYQ